MFFNAHNKGIATKLVEKIGREHPAGQPVCNAHTALVWLYLNFILLFYLVYDSWLRSAIGYFYYIKCFIIKCSQKFLKNHRKHLCWSLCRLGTLLKSDSNADVFLWILQNLQGPLFCKTNASGCFQRLWCNKVLPYRCSIEIWMNLKHVFFLSWNALFSLMMTFWMEYCLGFFCHKAITIYTRNVR